MGKKMLGNIKVNNLSKEEIIKELTEKLIHDDPANIYFLNDHAYNIAQKNEEFRGILNSADYLLNDGIGIELGAKLFGLQFKENLNGTDFIPALFQALNDNKQKEFRVFLLGAKRGIADKALIRLQEKFSELRFVGAHDGYFKAGHTEKLIKYINSTKPDILLVGFGMPLQEQWIYKHRKNLNCSLCFAVGAFFDFSSGTIKRAPSILLHLRLEWFYRLLKEPRRLWKRNVIGHILFFYTVFKQRDKLKRRN